MCIRDSTKTDFTIINTNARSLCQIINSLLDCFDEINANLAIITETWLTSGASLDKDIEDLRLGSGIGLPGAWGFSHGGVGIAYRGSTCTFRQLSIHNPEGYKVLAALGTIPGHSRKMLVLAVYIPPGDTASRGNGCLDFLEDLMGKFKRKYSDPYTVFGGDFNQWQVEDIMADFIEMAEVDVGPTRGSRCIDRTFTKKN